MTTWADRVPQHLVNAILGGRCIAFVGAGFSQPAVPGWTDFLVKLAHRLEITLAPPNNANALWFELIGQALRHAAGSADSFELHVKAVLDEHHALTDARSVAGRDTVSRRRDLLAEIPLKAILTTNFDNWLRGGVPEPRTYWDVLREDNGRWWDFPMSASDERPTVPIINLHGHANGSSENSPLVLGREDYRRRVYGEHGYTGFIRAAFAEYTVLFLGVSFTDAYLNELRSETLQFLHDPNGPLPWGYSIMKVDDSTREMPRLFLEHEGIHVLEITEFNQWDLWLEGIHARTSVRGRLTDLLRGQTIIWVDARPENNDEGRTLFESCGAIVTSVTSEHELDEVRDAGAALIVTQFGYMNPNDSRADRVLDRMQAWRRRPPVIVFASNDSPLVENRVRCLRRGAWEYACEWSELYRLIEVLFKRVPGRPNL